jgi:hypothetical protein
MTPHKQSVFDPAERILPFFNIRTKASGPRLNPDNWKACEIMDVEALDAWHAHVNCLKFCHLRRIYRGNANCS